MKLERVHYSLHKRAAGIKWSRLIEAVKVISGAEYLQNQFRLLVTFKTHVSHVYDTRVFAPAWRDVGKCRDRLTDRPINESNVVTTKYRAGQSKLTENVHSVVFNCNVDKMNAST